MSSLRVTSLRGRTVGVSPTLPDGAVVTGVTTSTSAIVGSAVTINSTGIDAGAGIITATSFSDGIGKIRSIPQNAQTSSYTLVIGDSGKHISITTGGVTIPPAVFSAGDTSSIYNNSGSTQIITQGSGVTLRYAGSASTGNRSLLQYGIATVLCVSSNNFVISGTGLN